VLDQALSFGVGTGAQRPWGDASADVETRSMSEKTWFTRHGEAIVLALVAHELAAGAAFTIAGLPGVGSALWAVGTGLALGDMLVELVPWLRARRWSRQLVRPIALLVAVIGAAAGGVYLVGNLLGMLGVLVAMFPPQRWGRRQPADVRVGPVRSLR